MAIENPPFMDDFPSQKPPFLEDCLIDECRPKLIQDRFSAIPLAPPHLAVAVSGCSQDIIRDAHGAVSGHLKAAARSNKLSRTCVENARIIRENQLVTPINIIQCIYTYIHYYSFTFHSLDYDYLRYQTYVHA